MKNFTLAVVSAFLLMLVSCGNNQNANSQNNASAATPNYGGFPSQVAWGEHLVKGIGCTECHSPKRNMVVIDSLYLSGYHAGISKVPNAHREEVEKEGEILGNDDWTAFAGPWGISYSANLTSDGTGIGNWDETNFLKAIKLGEFMGLDNSRQLLPPMPWHDFSNLSDDELKAIFAYLKTVKPVHNVVSAPTPPLSKKGA